MQDSQYLHLLFMDFVDCNERKRGQHEFTSPLDAAGAPAILECIERVNALDYVECNPSRGFRSIFGNVVGDSLKIVRGVARPPDAHHAR